MPVKPSLARGRKVLHPKKAKTSTPSGLAKAGNLRNSSMAEETIISPMAGASLVDRTRYPIDVMYTSNPPVTDTLKTTTSDAQDDTVGDCLPLLAAEDDELEYNAHGVPRLRRQEHIAFLRKTLRELPPPFVAADASRPWMLYWALNGMSLLGADVFSYRDGVVATARHLHNDTGGFGGGYKHTSHLATTYAMVLALVIVGGDAAYEVIDRKAMWKWLSSLKQPDGGFQMSLGGEVDVRGAYCAAVLISLLNIPLDLAPESPAKAAGLTDLYAGVADYVRRCQTFEGGISGKPDAEAHGAYAFCALACLSVLDAPHRIIPRVLDVPRLISWLSSRQYAPEGGFSGRTNKLVDGCYSHWVGACWPLLQASLEVSSGWAPKTEDDQWPLSKYPNLYDREGLIRYILSCGQEHGPRGGMRDKPNRRSDAYHTCYVLSGLTSAQHIVTSLSPAVEPVANVTWNVAPYPGPQVFEEEDRLNPTDPVYAIPDGQRKQAMSYFSSRPGF